MRFTAPLILSALLLLPLFSDAQLCEWARNGRSGVNQYNASGVDVARDAQGNIYLVGAFDSVFTMMGQTVTNLFPGKTGTVLARLTPEGGLTWLRKIDGNTFIPAGLAVQGSDVLVVGSYQNNITINGGSGGPVNFSGQGLNGILLRFDTDGNYLLGRNFTSPNNAFVSDVIFINATTVLFAGRFRQSLSIQSTTISVTGPNASNTYGFYGRMQTNGTVEWLKISGNAGNYCEPTALAAEAGGTFYLAGVYRQGLAFGNLSTPAPGSNLATLPFLARFNASGDPLWVQGSTVPSGSAALGSFCSDVRVLQSGQVMVTGGFSDRVTFLGLTSSPGHSAFALRVQNNGTIAASHLVESNQAGNRYEFIEQDNSGNIWLGGQVRGALTVRNNGTVFSQGHQTTATDILLAHYQGGLNFDGIALIGGSGDDRLFGATMDGQGRLYATGSYTGNLQLAGSNFNSSGPATSDLLLTRICSFSILSSVDAQADAGLAWPVWPNPVRDRLYIALPEGGDGYAYTLWDLMGRPLREGRVQGGTQDLDLSGLIPGHYYLQVRQGWETRVMPVQIVP
jgi:hypothetical protein